MLVGSHAYFLPYDAYTCGDFLRQQRSINLDDGCTKDAENRSRFDVKTHWHEEIPDVFWADYGFPNEVFSPLLNTSRLSHVHVCYSYSDRVFASNLHSYCTKRFAWRGTGSNAHTVVVKGIFERTSKTMLCQIIGFRAAIHSGSSRFRFSVQGCESIWIRCV